VSVQHWQQCVGHRPAGHQQLRQRHPHHPAEGADREPEEAAAGEGCPAAGERQEGGWTLTFLVQGASV